ncbi:gliding motility-associated ABC transporter substrate-binding protein GldG [Weeksella virosa]|uniref:Gliding-associated putative ABC transporter substrate-binding component GldG n=1 Tax=Weeksella virosa (strain ATCC 43766 / DSM 16922 / JCM 21250 / CCUG 30538 / CDC 9751 / IAM 14551 / NBRC 16016 / NCTC 11634 / CL345/78) TaxID=865938 RepID=F0NYQ4_WEEVC|nr:gliding motility-associated ABC transporter substrate-binding protein GldG [Weeksella virosa]ADX68185.1 gliding-associated putative ABC transporter substrate-binding component GldG [Weeksella virosa DSM 16922]VEH64178.1 gliding-associated putative ABC transporter substrate-binding component GldG [Weeksella virosa]
MKKYRSFLYIIGLLLIWIVGFFVFHRYDLTQDKRYTLSSTSESLIQSLDSPLHIDILLGGELTADYRNLRNDIQFLLDELQERNKNLTYTFLDPIDISETEKEEAHLSPAPIKTDKGILNVYPYAKISYQEKTRWMEVLINDPSITFESLPQASSEKLEYLFADKIQQITSKNRKKVGLIVHHDELPENKIDGFGRALADKYDVGVYLNPIINKSMTLQASDLDSLRKFDALVIAKPTLPFTEMDKLVLDQYIMHGGKTLWAVETVDAEMDSIFRSGKIVAFPRDLQLNDFLFNYGIRIHPMIIKDLNGSPIVLADGETAGNTSYNYYPWPYFELGTRAEDNPITQSIDPVLFQFANPIEIIPNKNIKPTVLLASSAQTTLKPALNFIQLNEVNIENPEEYKMGRIPMAVLIEGDFSSAYAMRYERKEFPNYRGATKDGKMVVISDGDVLKNNLWRGMPMRLGEDKYSMRPDNPNMPPKTYANQTFLMNTMDYLLGNEDFLALRNRQLQTPKLSESKVVMEKKSWQMKNLLIPTFIILLVGALANWYRKRKYTRL